MAERGRDEAKTVWTVLEPGDYATVAIYATQELAEAHCDRMNQGRRWAPYVCVEEVVATELPPQWSG